MRYAKLTYSIILLGAAVWCSSIVLAPIFAASSGNLKEVGEVLYTFFSPICHQLDARSFHINGMPFGVCARCFAIYVGFFVGILFYPVLRRIEKPRMPSRWILFLACAPMVVDASAWRFGLYEATSVTRAVTGGIAGFTLAFFIVSALIPAMDELAGDRSTVFHQSKGISDATETG